MSAPNYPRPQLLRADWLSLDGGWRYSFDETTLPQEVRWAGEILVPYPPESPCSGVNDPGFHPVLWYARDFHIPQAWSGKRILLHFGAVDYTAQVWVNGQLCSEHEGGHTPFQVDITAYLLEEGEQRIVVRAADDPLDLEKPRGKQDWERDPHGIWYPRTTGIWQPVWLEPVSAAHLAKLRLTPDPSAFAFHAELEFNAPAAGPLQDLCVELSLSLDGKELVTQTWPVERGRASGSLGLPRTAVADPRDWLWSPENPVLFDLLITLKNGPEILDRVESYAGLRSVEARDGQFFLNGQPYFLQMVLDQGYWAESHLAAPGDEALRRDVELTKEMGFNGVRKHQKIEDPRYLYWADRLGLIVWGEMPSPYRFSPLTIRRLTQEFLEMIERDYNHPSVVAWVPVNESWGIPEVRDCEPQRQLAQSLYHLGKAMDPTRLVVDNDGWEHTRTDLMTIHDYDNRPEVFARRYNTLDCLTDRLDHHKDQVLPGFDYQGEPILLSEFGGIKMGDGAGWGYQRVNGPEEFLERFAPLMRTVYGKVLAGYCYTQLADTFQEQNGLLTMDRRPKVDPAIIAGILRQGLEARKQDNLEPVN